MASQGTDPAASGSQDTQSTRTIRAKRGKVCLTSVAQRRAKGVIEDLRFNKDVQPVGKQASQMQSYIGLLVRDHVKISFKNWKAVPQDVKHTIWALVKASYKVPETWKAQCLKSANSKWRTWKCRMYKDFIVPNKDDATKLYIPLKDEGILEQDWRVFVHSRVSNEFKQLSEL